jgi:hypothetical protein
MMPAMGIVAGARLTDAPIGVDSGRRTRLHGSGLEGAPRVSHHEKGMAKDADKKTTTKKPATKKK